MKLAFATDSLLYARAKPPPGMHTIPTPFGAVRVRTEGDPKAPAIVLVPDGPFVVEHYDSLLSRLGRDYFVVCFDLPGFGFSHPRAGYDHSFAAAVSVIEQVLDQLGLARVTLAFTCANGFYALAFASRRPERVARLVLGQTPSFDTMLAWMERVVPKPIRVPVVGQLINYAQRQRLPGQWFGICLPDSAPRAEWTGIACSNLHAGGCFCFASVVQGLWRCRGETFAGIVAPTVMLWGERDRSHRKTDPESLLSVVPHARIVRLPSVGHCPHLEDPDALLAALTSS
jgi:pimeloyl-ACP methyl ester carboxylesterase